MCQRYLLYTCTRILFIVLRILPGNEKYVCGLESTNKTLKIIIEKYTAELNFNIENMRMFV